MDVLWPSIDHDRRAPLNPGKAEGCASVGGRAAGQTEFDNTRKSSRRAGPVSIKQGSCREVGRRPLQYVSGTRFQTLTAVRQEFTETAGGSHLPSNFVLDSVRNKRHVRKRCCWYASNMNHSRRGLLRPSSKTRQVTYYTVSSMRIECRRKEGHPDAGLRYDAVRVPWHVDLVICTVLAGCSTQARQGTVIMYTHYTSTTKVL